MKEKIKSLLSGLLLIGCGAAAWMMSDEYVLMLFGVLKVDFKIFAVILAAIGLITAVMGLLPQRKGEKAAPQPKQKSRKTVKEEPRTEDIQAPVYVPDAPQVDVRSVVLSAREAGTPEAYRQTIAMLEPYQEADPANGELAAGMLACYDGLLRTKGDKTFGDYQQRFYAALRAVYLEEQTGKKPTSRRFWAIHCAVHGGIAAASAKDLEQLEDASYMLERAAQLKSEGSREVDQQYTETAIPCVRCWVAYWIARITATEKPDYDRSAEALQLAATLFPREGDIRVCDMNPHMQGNTKTVLTWNNLDALRRHLIKVAGE